MDTERFAAFITQLRKERGLTQKELADRLNVTDKAVSKWETGKGFPDLKLLEPLARELGVSLVELMQGRRQEADTLTVTEAGAVVSQAMGQSERTTARRYLRLFRWCLIGICGLCLLFLTPTLAGPLIAQYFIQKEVIQGGLDVTGVIGGAAGPTAILTASRPFSPLTMFLEIGIPLLLLAVCVVLAVKVWRLEKKLK